MIQILMLVVLAVIAVVLAPWLIGLAAMAAAAYGVYVVILCALMGIAIIVGATWAVATSMRKTKQDAPPIAGGRVTCKNCQAEVSDRLARCDNCHQKL